MHRPYDPIRARGLPLLLATLIVLGVDSADAARWQMRGGDIGHTQRADFVVPVERQNARFFATVRWQKPSPADGGFAGSAMVFFDGAGPGGGDLVIGTYAAEKGVTGMNRHTGARWWHGSAGGGEEIAVRTPAFSNDGRVLYVSADSASQPLVAFAAATGPAVRWGNAGMADPQQLAMRSPIVAPDGRLFLHPWAGPPHAGSDLGDRIERVWSAATFADPRRSDVALFPHPQGLRVIIGDHAGRVVAWDGASGAQRWQTLTSTGIDAPASIDPVTGNIYIPAGFGHIDVIGLDIDGNPLWGTPARRVYQHVPGVNPLRRSGGGGALAHDGATFYFQTHNPDGEGQLHAIDTATGSVRWTFDSGSVGSEFDPAAPLVTPNGVLVFGNNDGGVYFAVRDDGDAATLLATLMVDAPGRARGTPTLSSDGVLYLPLRTTWTRGNGDGDVPDGTIRHVYTAFDLSPRLFRGSFESSAAW